MTPPSSSPAVARPRAPAPHNVFGVTVTVLAGGAETGGACSIARIVCAPGPGAPRHRHAQIESFYVIRGRLTVQLGADTIAVAAGEFVQVPAGAAHNFANTGETDVEFLAIGTPSGHEDFFRDADELARSGRFNPGTAGEVCRRNGIELLF